MLNISNNSIGLAAGVAAFALSMTFAPLANAQTATGTPPDAPAAGASSKPSASASAQPASLGNNMPVRDASVQAYLRVHREPIKQPVTQTGCKAAMAPGKPYFVEFRSRGAQSYGHTFVFHGRLGAGNRFASFSVAGLHPKGEEASTYIQGHWAPVPAETGVSWGDLDEQYLTARFCVALTEQEYRRAVVYIRNLQATKKTWHAGTYNCNSFAADIAKFIGLDTPNPNMYLPERFINRLAEDNRGRRADAGTAFSNWLQPAQSTGQASKQR